MVAKLEIKKGISKEIITTICKWAETQPLVKRITAFGSRVAGTERSDSDLDLAFEIYNLEDEDKFTTWICEKSKLFNSLQKLIEIDLQIELLDEEVSTPNISAAVKKNSLVIYEWNR